MTVANGVGRARLAIVHVAVPANLVVDGRIGDETRGERGVRAFGVRRVVVVGVVVAVVINVSIDGVARPCG